MNRLLYSSNLVLVGSLIIGDLFWKNTTLMWAAASGNPGMFAIEVLLAFSVLFLLIYGPVRSPKLKALLAIAAAACVVVVLTSGFKIFNDLLFLSTATVFGVAALEQTQLSASQVPEARSVVATALLAAAESSQKTSRRSRKLKPAQA